MAAPKEKVYIGVLAGDSKVNVSLAMMAYQLPLVTFDPGSRFEFMFHIEDGVRPQEYARNRIIERFLKTDGETLLMIDNDMVQLGWKTMAILDTPDYDIAGPLQLMWHPINYHQGRDVPELYPCVMNWVDEPNHKMTPIYPQKVDETIIEVDAVGSGCIAIKRRVLEDPRMEIEVGMSPPAFFRNEYEANGNRTRGLDVAFCKRAKDLGYTVKANYNAEIGHLKTVDLNQVNIYGMWSLRKGMEGVSGGR